MVYNVMMILNVLLLSCVCVWGGGGGGGHDYSTEYNPTYPMNPFQLLSL